MTDFPYRKFPCNECPIRKDNAGKPQSCFSEERWDALAVTVREGHNGDNPGMDDILFGCHKGAPGTDEDLACAGWLVQFGGDHMRIRVLQAYGHIPTEAFTPGPDWPALHDTWDDVRANHTADSCPVEEQVDG